MDEIQEVTASQQQIVSYNITDQDLADLAARHQHVDAHADYAIAKVAATECQKLRKVLEEARVEKKREALRFGQRVDSEAKRIREAIEAVENPIRAGLKLIDDAEKAKETDRVYEIEDRIATIRDQGLNLDDLSMEDLVKRSNWVTGQLLTVEDKEPFEEFLLDAEGTKAETESRLRIAVNKLGFRLIEEEKLETQRQEQEAQQKKLDEQQAKIDEQKRKQDAIEAERNREAAEEAERKSLLHKKEQDEADAIRREDLDREQASLKQMRDRLEKEEAEEKAKEEAKAAEIARLAAAPDVEKLNKLSDDLGGFPLPDMATIQGKKVMTRVRDDLGILIHTIRTKAGDMQ